MLLRNSVFVHVPRTGGMWVRALACRLGFVVMESRDDFWNHACHADLPVALRAMPSFACVRHPLMWARSRWAHSLAINACQECRFRGVHAEFDALVRPTLADTLREILTTSPGLVGKTFTAATQGVTHRIRTRDLPGAAVAVLTRLEGVSQADAEMAVECTSPINGSSPDAKAAALPDGLAEEFLASEGEALRIWEGANGV